jgi:predicted nucleic acid-binding protein
VADKYTLDTNILIYAIDSSQGAKHKLAAKLVLHAAAQRQPLMLQSLNEMSAVILRKRMIAASRITTLLRYYEQSFEIISSQPEDLYAAINAQQTHNLAFFDAMLWATSKRAGCRILLTEDFQDGRTLEDVRFLNPFTMNFSNIKKAITAI